MDADWFTPEREIRQRHKRPHAEMSSVTLSPSPIIFRGPTSSFGSVSRYNSAAPSNNDSFLERRRTSHPHNPPIHPFQAAAEDMPQRSQSQLHPRLEHRSSQTLIDLTEEDGDDVPLVLRDRAPSQRPPQLGRSDAQRLAEFIDLTEDDAEIQIIEARSRQLPLPRPDVARPRPHLHLPLPRPASPGLFVPLDPPQPRNLPRAFHDAGAFGVMVGAGGVHVLQGQGGLAHLMQHVQAMPGRMDYRHPAFADRKPEHIPPEPAKPGFTRSPAENDTIICPSCEEELVHDKDLDEPVVKKNGKPPSKKEREEHPFWVAKDCGHVYCNHCYQNRHPSTKQPANVSFPDKAGKGKTRTPLCAVEGCESDLKDKLKWVGVFL